LSATKASRAVSAVATGRKVLIIVENLPVPFDRRVWRESQALREAGYHVSIIAPREVGQPSREVIDGVSVYRYSAFHADGGFASYVLEYLVALFMSFWLTVVVLCREGFDVIQICNPPDLLVFAALPFKLLGKRIIFDQHDVCPEIYQAQRNMAEGDRSLILRALFFFERLTYVLSDVVMVVNESCRRVALSRGLMRSADVFVVRNGPSRDSVLEIRPNPALKEGRRYLLVYVGMMGPQDGIDVLLRVVRHLFVRYRREDFHVRIVGGGTVLEQMQRYAQTLEIQSMVTFTGRVQHKEVLESIASADVCLCPDPKTPLSDKCSLVKSIEYMSLGKPFVAFDLEEVRRSAGDSALYAESGGEDEFAAKVNALLSNDDLRRTMGERGRERVLHGLTWEHSKEALHAAYDRAHRRAEDKRAEQVG
jgi:glycosyltransferase involved in cell wall biosynthesis